MPVLPRQQPDAVSPLSAVSSSKSRTHFQPAVGTSASPDEPSSHTLRINFFAARSLPDLKTESFRAGFDRPELCDRPPTMIGVNSLHSAGRLRSRSLCTVRYGRDFRMMDPFRYPRTPRSRSLKPLVFPDLLGKAQDGQNHPQARKRRKVVKTSSCYFDTSVRLVMCQLIFRNFRHESFFFTTLFHIV